MVKSAGHSKQGIIKKGSGIRDQGSGIRDQGSGIRVQGSGFREGFASRSLGEGWLQE